MGIILTKYILHSQVEWNLWVICIEYIKTYRMYIYDFFPNSKPVHDRKVIAFYHTVYVMMIACHDLQYNYHVYVYIYIYYHAYISIHNRYVYHTAPCYALQNGCESNSPNFYSLYSDHFLNILTSLNNVAGMYYKSCNSHDPFNGLATLLLVTQSHNRPPVGIYNVPSSRCHRFATMPNLERSVNV